ncbi:hypothetical protein B0H10DRAFT_1946053 [Mycena sp. CBHHK59/15]|nr:hypothetical protein B0H10DRAFT_1946053 [Mycena sp. CBHHK59/15]
MHHAHGNGVLPVTFLAIPKTSKKHRSKPAYQKFCCQMYHASLVLMTTPEIVCCPDGHLCQIVYGIGLYIADYPEQVWLAGVVQNWCPKCKAHLNHLDAGAHLCMQTKTDIRFMCFDPGILWDDYGIRSDVPFTHGFPRADIHELLLSDLLHHVIKGTFKDHIVSWINDYLHLEHGKKQALEIIQDIDRRISAVPEFPGLCCFPDGCNFSQWTGDDPKALMKIYLGAVTGYLSSDMVKCLAAFMDFCYLHSLIHYIRFIFLFSSPNGLCSSITESKHIKAVKEPWQRSSWYKVLAQMPVILNHLNKLAAATHKFTTHGIMIGTTLLYTARVLTGEQPQVLAAAAEAAAASQDDNDNDNGDDGDNRSVGTQSTLKLWQHIGQPHFTALFWRFLYEEVHGPPDDDAALLIPLNDCPIFTGQLTVHHSAVTRFYVPSDLCGAGGMYHEWIHSDPHWHSHAQWEVLIDVGAPVMGGLVIGCVLLFFSLTYAKQDYQCALITWLVPVGNTPDPDLGMWVVEPEYKGTHLIGVYGTAALLEDFHYSDTLDAFNTYFISPYADHHMHEFLM